MRQLHFRGIEFSTTYGFFGSSPTYAGPKVEIRDAVVNPNFAPAIRYIPGPNLYATFTSIPGLVPGGATTPPIVRICYDLGPGFSVVVPAGSSSGLGLAAVWFDMAPIPAGQGLMILGSGLEPMTWPASASFSGVTDLAGNSVLLPNPGFSSEYTFTWLFEDSMIQPVRNAKLLPAGSQIPGSSQPGPIRRRHGRRPRDPLSECWGCDFLQRQFDRWESAPGPESRQRLVHSIRSTFLGHQHSWDHESAPRELAGRQCAHSPDVDPKVAG